MKLAEQKINQILAVAVGFSLIAPFPSLAYSRIFLTTGTTWTVPGDWSNINVIEAFGAGGGGGDGTTAGGGGGGGGAYATISNLSTLTKGSSVTYQIGSTTPAVATALPGVKGGDSYFNRTGGSSFVCDSGNMSLCAKGGNGGGGGSSVDGTGGTGGTAAASVGTIKFNGGNGGTGQTESDGGGGGGGAGGQYGNGANGSNGDTEADLNDGVGGGGGGAGGGTNAQTLSGTPTVGAYGGDNFFKKGGGLGGSGSAGGAATSSGAGGGGGADTFAGGVGGQGFEYGNSGGSGGGGGGGGDAGNGANGAQYGGGGGGSEGNTEGLGAQGVVVITYISLATTSPRILRLHGVRLHGVRLMYKHPEEFLAYIAPQYIGVAMDALSPISFASRIAASHFFSDIVYAKEEDEFLAFRSFPW